MKKVSFIIIVLVAAAAFLVFQPKRNPEKPAASKPESPVTLGTSSGEVAPSPMKSVDGREISQTLRAGFLSNEVMAAVRVALADKDRTGYDAAFKSLIDYINAHPEAVDDYVSVLRSEPDEHVLRTFALALAETEVGLLADEKIIAAAMDLAKDSSFEQRQHIMLNLMSKFPEMRDDVFGTVLGLTQQDPNSQVKTSAVVVFADWMERHPDKSGMLLDKVGEIFKTAEDDDVRAFTYQLLALHRNALSPELQTVVAERFRVETDPHNGNLLAMTLADASEEIRQGALAHARTAFDSERDSEMQRNLLVQIVCLGKESVIPLLQKNLTGHSLLAQDARDYLNLFAAGTPFEPEAALQAKAIRDAQQHASNEPHPEHKD